MSAMPGPKPDPNTVTTDNAIRAPEREPAPEGIAPGEVLKKGAPPPKPGPGQKGEALVTVRITKAGHGEVHDGKGGRYDWNDEVALPRSVAEALEDRHFAETQG
jgi:hypothetical protein